MGAVPVVYKTSTREKERCQAVIDTKGMHKKTLDYLGIKYIVI